MNLKVAGALLALCLSGCAAQQTQPGTVQATDAQAHLDALRSALPGNYSNFAQIRAAGGTGVVTDVLVRYLAVDLDGAFLVSTRTREGGTARHQLYRFTAGTGTDVLLARFAPLEERQLDQPLATMLGETEARFRKGCELALSATAAGLVGQTDPATCRFSHPDAGTVGLLREFSFGRGQLDFAERLLDTSGNRVGEDGVLRLQKHRRFTGWAGKHVDAEAAADDPTAWRLAESFDLADDGRVRTLVDVAGDSLDLGLQLSRIRRGADRGTILRLSLVDLKTGEVLAYAWTDPGAESIGIHLDWFQAGLEIAETP